MLFQLVQPGKEPMILLYDPDHVEQIYRAAGPRPDRSGFFALDKKRRGDAALGGDKLKLQGLLATKGEEWWEFRRKVQQPMLKPKATERYTQQGSHFLLNKPKSVKINFLFTDTPPYWKRSPRVL